MHNGTLPALVDRVTRRPTTIGPAAAGSGPGVSPGIMKLLARVLAIALITAGGLAAAQGRVVAPRPDGLVSVRAEAAPLGQILRELAALAPLELRIDPAVESVPVTLQLEDVAAGTALLAVLRGSGVDVVVSGWPRPGQPERARVVAGRAEAAREVVVAHGASAGAPASVDAPAAATADEARERKKELDAEVATSEPDDPGDTPGNMTPEEWLKALVPARPPARIEGPVMLPFVDEFGEPLVQTVVPAPNAPVMLPFVDDQGQPLVVPRQPAPMDLVLLPFVEDGRPVIVPAVPRRGSPAPTVSKVPGFRPGER